MPSQTGRNRDVDIPGQWSPMNLTGGSGPQRQTASPAIDYNFGADNILLNSQHVLRAVDRQAPFAMSVERHFSPPAAWDMHIALRIDQESSSLPAPSYLGTKRKADDDAESSPNIEKRLRRHSPPRQAAQPQPTPTPINVDFVTAQDRTSFRRADGQLGSNKQEGQKPDATKNKATSVNTVKRCEILDENNCMDEGEDEDGVKDGVQNARRGGKVGGMKGKGKARDDEAMGEEGEDEEAGATKNKTMGESTVKDKGKGKAKYIDETGGEDKDEDAEARGDGSSEEVNVAIQVANHPVIPARELSRHGIQSQQPSLNQQQGSVPSGSQRRHSPDDEVTPKQNCPHAGPSRLVQDHAGQRKGPLDDNHVHHNPLQFVARKKTVWYTKENGARAPKSKHVAFKDPSRSHENPQPSPTHPAQSHERPPQPQGSPARMLQILDDWEAEPEGQVRRGDMAVLFRGFIDAASKDKSAPTTPARSRRRERDNSDERVEAPQEIRNRMEVKHRTNSENELRKHIRQAALLWMGRKNNPLKFHLPPSDAVEKYYKTAKKSDGPSFSTSDIRSNPLRIDLNASASSSWNVRCFRIFAKEYVKLSNSLCQDVDTVQSIFRGQFKGLKVAYRKVIRDKLSDNEKTKQAKEVRRSKTNSRVYELANRRLKAAGKHKDSKKWVPLLKRAGRGIHSDDEIQLIGGTPVAMTRQMVWRSEELAVSLHTCDTLNLADKLDEAGDPKTGTWPRPRIEGLPKSTRPPVKGLPRNCYDKEWLDKLDSDDLEDLHVDEEEVDLSVSSRLEEVCKTVKDNKNYKEIYSIPGASTSRVSRATTLDAPGASSSESE